MKKTLLLCTALVLVLSACTPSGNATTKTNSESSQASSSFQENASSTAVGTEDTPTPLAEFDAAKVKAELETETFFFRDDRGKKALAVKITNTSEFCIHINMYMNTYNEDGSPAQTSYSNHADAIAPGQTFVTADSFDTDFAEELTKLDIRVRLCDDNLIPMGSDYSYTSTMDTIESSKGLVYRDNLVITNNGDSSAKNLYVAIICLNGDTVVDCWYINLYDRVAPGQSYNWSPTTRNEHDSIQVYFTGEAEI